jgi:hypothetical protein
VVSEGKTVESAGVPKAAEYLHHCYQAAWDQDAHGLCWVRVFAEAEQTSIIVLSALPKNITSASSASASFEVLI